MPDLDTTRLLTHSLTLLEYSGKKTLNVQTLLASFRICYFDNQRILNEGISEGTKFCTIYTSLVGDELKKFKEKINYGEHHEIIKNFLSDEEIKTHIKIKIDSAVPVFLSGLCKYFEDK